MIIIIIVMLNVKTGFCKDKLNGDVLSTSVSNHRSCRNLHRTTVILFHEDYYVYLQFNTAITPHPLTEGP
jgi:hypothetical protein